MRTRDEPVQIAVGDDRIRGDWVQPAGGRPGVLMIHGWGGSRAQYLARAHRVAALGCVALVFDLRGHAASAHQFETVSREQNLQDVLAAYDALAGHPEVDRQAIAVAGSSYGGYLAALLTASRAVRWLALRVPALYRDEDWSLPKLRLDRALIDAYRRRPVEAARNRALAACSAFEGDVLIVRSEHDPLVPVQVIDNYRSAFVRARSLRCRTMEGADHGLTDVRWQQDYTAILCDWLRERLAQVGEHARAAAASARPIERAVAETAPVVLDADPRTRTPP
jgi:hypothetical protein